MQTVVFAPGATTAGDNIDIPSGSPSIGKIISATLYDPSSGASSVTATKVDRNTITLDSDTTATQLLILMYYAEGEIRTP